MPLDKFLPQIDDRCYDDIILELRTRIARYTPEWTPVWSDVNESDPGITMVELFAWLTEMLIYRMNKVPALNYLKFLQLLGMELNPAEPALVELSFPVKALHSDPFVIVPERTQVTAESPEGGPPLLFETDRALIALTAQLASIQVFDGSTSTLATAQNSAAIGFQPFGPSAREQSALMLGFSYAPNSPIKDFPTAEINLTVWVTPEERSRSYVQCGRPTAYAQGPARIRWEFYNGKEWESLDLLKDETQAFTRSGGLHLKKPARGEMPLATLGVDNTCRFWIRGRIETSQYERAPKLLAIRTNTVSARQAETVRKEVLGGSNGRRDQIFTLANTPVLRDTLRLEVDQGSGFETWQCVDDFFGSCPNDLHYTLNRTSGEIRFGDGKNGSIPVANPDMPGTNVMATEYRFGGGSRGNLPAGSIKTLATPINGIDDGGIINLLASYAGRNEETLEQAKKRAPSMVKSRCRAVTSKDFECLATQAANIRRAKALPLYHPDFPGVKVPGVVTVVVVPDSDQAAPMPSDSTLRTVSCFLDQHRLLTTEVYVVKPNYQQVQIATEVIVANDADLQEVKEAVQSTLLEYFHPLKGGEEGEGWPFGGTIYYSRVYQFIFKVQGVQSIKRMEISLDGESYPVYHDLPLQGAALAYSLRHDVDVQYCFDN